MSIKTKVNSENVVEENNYVNKELFLSMEEYHQALYEEQSQMTLKGFRKGKVPLILVQQIKQHDYILNKAIQGVLWHETLLMMQKGQSVKNVQRTNVEFVKDKGWKVFFDMQIENISEEKTQ